MLTDCAQGLLVVQCSNMENFGAALLLMTISKRESAYTCMYCLHFTKIATLQPWLAHVVNGVGWKKLVTRLLAGCHLLMDGSAVSLAQTQNRVS